MPEKKDAAKYVLDVNTMSWGSRYFATYWHNYQVVYTVRARLIDNESKKVVSEGSCRQKQPESGDGAPTWDELTGNGAGCLKSILQSYAEACAKTLKSEMFAIQEKI